jgi:hypothetical protein
VRGIPNIEYGVGFRVHLHWLSDKFPHVEDVVTVMTRVWQGKNSDGLGWLGNVKLSCGRPPQAMPGSYAHLFVGVDLSWYREPGLGRVGGYTPHYMGLAPGEPWAVRGGFADDALCLTSLALGALVLHECGHLFLPAEQWHELERDPEVKRKVAVLRGAAAGARDWAGKM